MKIAASYVFAASLMGISISCDRNEDEKKQGETKEEVTNAPSEEVTNAPSFDICTLKKDKETKNFPICTKEFLESDRIDGKFCFVENCEIPETNLDECPPYFVKAKSASVPDEKFCNYGRPVEL